MKYLKAFFNWLRDLVFGSSITRLADRNERRFRRWLKTTDPRHGKKVELVKVYTDKRGNNFYIHTDPLDIIEERATRIDEAAKAHEFNMPPDEVLEKLATLQEALEKARAGDLSKVSEAVTTCADVRFRMSELGEVKTMLNLAALFFYIDDESPYNFNPEAVRRKLELAASDDDLRAFFLRVVHRIYKRSKSIAEQDFVAYLYDKKMHETRQK